MRPPDLPGGNGEWIDDTYMPDPKGFNEAAGFTRRKLQDQQELDRKRSKLQ